MIEKEKLDREKTVILVIDIQNDFCSKDSFAVKNWNHDISHFDLIIGKIRNFLGESYIQGFDILYTKTIYDPEKISKATIKKLGEYVGEYVAPNSNGVEFYKINPQKDKIFVKYGFDAFQNKELVEYLKSNRVENVILIGFNSNLCLESTARSAIEQGFYPIIIKDLTGTPTFMQGHENELFKTFSIIFGDVVSSEEILNEWNKKDEI